MAKSWSQLGVVAIGRNEGIRLKACLRSVPDGIPIVYVDSGSTDGSASFPQAHGTKVVELDPRQPFTAARARNEGFMLLMLLRPELKFVQFVDGDCELERDWLGYSQAFLSAHPAYDAVCGRRRERFPEVSYYNQMCDDEWDTPIGDCLACGGDALFRVSAIRAAGGFDPLVIAGEEPELCARLRSEGWMIRRLDLPMTIHDANMMEMRQWWLRSVRSGFGYAQVWWKTRSSGISPIYGRQIASSLFWAMGIPATSIVAALIWSLWALLGAPAAWGGQFLNLTFPFGWRKSAHLLFGKFAEAFGAGRYAVVALQGRKQEAIFYK